MAIAKKGTRKIIVKGEKFLYKISKYKTVSDWRASNNELNSTFMKYATQFGLGQVKDIVFNIVIQHLENPVSTMCIKCESILVDGFMGPEQLLKIQPNFIAEQIKQALENGWNPLQKGDYRTSVKHEDTLSESPVILQLPDFNEGADEEYDSVEKPNELKFDKK